MTTTDLSTVLTQVVKDLDSNILKSPKLVGILADYHAFNVHDPLLADKKEAVVVLASDCYVDKLNEWKHLQGESWRAEDSQWIERLCKKTGYKRNVVCMIADAMKQAVGIKVDYNDFSNMKGMLNAAVEEYEAALKRLVKTYKNCIGLTNAYYPIDANTELLLLGGRMLIIAQAINSTRYDKAYIDKVRQDTMDSVSDSLATRQKTAREVLSKDGAEYASILKRQTKKSNDFSKLTTLAERLNCAFTILGDSKRIDVAKDMADAKKRIRWRRIKRALIIVPIAFILCCIVTYNVVRKIHYNECRAEIEVFNNTIEAGDKALADGDGVRALSLYTEAGNNYTASCDAYEHNKLVEKKQAEASYAILGVYATRIDSAIVSGNRKTAKALYDEALSLNLPTNDSTFRNEYNEKIYNLVVAQRDNLLTALYKSKGKASSETKAQLEELLSCYPDDYYLKMIKEKMK